MSGSVVGSIISNIQTTLLTISTASSYNYTIRTNQVGTREQFDSGIPEDGFPFFAIDFKSEIRLKEPGRLKKILNIDIICHFENPLMSTLESWFSDIERVLAVDHTRGGYAYETWIPSMNRNSDILDELQVYIINVEVRTLQNYGVL